MDLKHYLHSNIGTYEKYLAGVPLIKSYAKTTMVGLSVI